MNGSAVVFIVLAWGTVISCTVYCFYRMLTTPPGRDDEDQAPPTE